MHKDQTFFRIFLLTQFLDHVQLLKQSLRDELIDHASDPVIFMRRFRMLSQLSQYESQIIAKIENLNTDDDLDFLSQDFMIESNIVASRDG